MGGNCGVKRVCPESYIAGVDAFLPLCLIIFPVFINSYVSYNKSGGENLAARLIFQSLADATYETCVWFIARRAKDRYSMNFKIRPHSPELL
jgi:hypothetical protein